MRRSVGLLPNLVPSREGIAGSGTVAAKVRRDVWEQVVDDIDRALIQCLQEDAGRPYAALAAAVGPLPL